MSSFLDLVLILALVAGGGLITERLKVPLITVYLLAGIVLGPAGFNRLAPSEGVTSLGSLGVSLFLFSIALKLDTRTFRTLGWRALWAGIGQITLTALTALAVGYALGLRHHELQLAVPVLTLSSTIVVVKIFSEKKQLDSLHGQLAIAIAILQDIAVVLMLAGLGGHGEERAAPVSAAQRYVHLFLGALALGGAYLVAAQGVLRLLQHTLRNVELQLITVLALAASFAGLSSLLGFSREIGAFIAGLAVAASPYKESVGSRLAPLRDFLLLLFLIDLGSRIGFSGIERMAALGVAFSLFSLFVKPVIIILVVRALGYPVRTAFFTGVALAPVSEFSFLLGGTAATLGMLDSSFVSIIAAAGLCTFLISPLLLDRADELYARFAPLLERLLGREQVEAPWLVPQPDRTYKVLCLGLGRYGGLLARHLRDRGHTVLGIDFDPEALAHAYAHGLDVRYGDAVDEELYRHLPLAQARWVVCTIRSTEAARAVVRGLQLCGWDGHLALTAEDAKQAEDMERLGAHVVLRPYEDGAELAAEAITDAAELRLTLANWPVAFREFRVRSDAAYAGQTIAQLALRQRCGVTILALSRGGRVTFDPSPDMQIFPNDRLLVMGASQELEKASSLLEARLEEELAGSTHFEIERLRLRPRSSLVGKTLAESQFRQKYGLTVVGIERGATPLVIPPPTERLHSGDVIVVIGPEDRVAAIRTQPDFEVASA